MTQGRLSALLVLAGAMGLYSSAVSAEGVYTWTDEQGVVHFSDRAPDHGDARQLKLVEPVLVPMGDNLGGTEQLADTLARERRARRPDTNTTPDTNTSENDSAQARQCAGYREQLETIQSRLRAGYSNTEGNRLREQRRTLNGRLSRECILR